MRLGRNGEIIVETGFDGGNYSPRYASRTSVYLGDMSREDMRIKAQVDARNRAVAAQNVLARRAQAAEARQRFLVQDRIKQQIVEREARSNRIMEIAKAKGMMHALEGSKGPDVNPWVGSPFAGFGAAGEVRINPDSNEDVAIVDANIPSVKEYGINNWMEDPSALQDRVAQSATGWTDGKQVLQTMVDYAQTPDKSVVGMPLASQVSTDLATAQAAVEAQAAQVDTSNPMVRYGIYALAAWILLK